MKLQDLTGLYLQDKSFNEIASSLKNTPETRIHAKGLRGSSLPLLISTVTRLNDGIHLLILEDAREGDVHFDINQLNKLSEQLSSIDSKYNSVRHAVLVENARNVAYATLINDKIEARAYKLKVFFEKQEAEKWLLYN